MDSKKLTMLVNIGKAMLEEAKKSEASKKVGIDIKGNLKNIISVEASKKLVQDIIVVYKAKVDSIKEMLNSDEASFIKMAAKESEQGKKVASLVEKVTEGLEKLEDLVPMKIQIEYTNYKHWCINWFNISNMGLTAPLPVMKGMLKYTWIFDLLKFNAMATAYTQGRKGANVKQIQSELSFIVKDTCQILQYALVNPDKVIITQNMVPVEILKGMGLHNIFPELPSGVLPKAAQFSGVRYLDAAENKGLGADTCGMPRFTAGVALLDEMPMGRCIVASNLPCDGGLASYDTIQEKLGDIPIYRLNVPYDFRNDESIDTFVEDLKGAIKFLEANTDAKMDWDKLRETCDNYNEIIEVELERWELAKLDNTPLTNDAMWFPHLWGFNISTGTKEAAKQQRKLLEMAKKAYRKGIPAFEGMRYRAISWNPPPTCYAHWWNWLERCWGIGVVMDLETCGKMEHIDTSTPETMLRGLGRRFMWGTMAKHTRGPANNMIEDLLRVVGEYRADFVILPAHIGCKNSMSMESVMRDELKKINTPFCVFKYELLDSRVASRQEIRDQISKFMTEIMHAEPLDASLLQIDDGGEDKW